MNIQIDTERPDRRRYVRGDSEEQLHHSAEERIALAIPMIHSDS